MPEEKIKVKDIMSEMNVSSKDMFRALRDCGISAKSTSISVSIADSDRIRGYLSERKEAQVERSTSQSDVVVRRRRKNVEPVKTDSEAVSTKEVEKKEQPVKKIVESENKPENQQGAQAKATSTKETSTKTQSTSQKSRKSQSSSRSKKNIPVADARIISRPTDEVITPQVVETEPVKKKVSKKPSRQGKTLAEEIREKEAAEKAKAVAEAKELKKKIERKASVISKPQAESIEKVEESKIESQVEVVIPVEKKEPKRSPVLSAIMSRNKTQANDGEGKTAFKEQREKRHKTPKGSSNTGDKTDSPKTRIADFQNADNRKGAGAGKSEAPRVPRVKVISRPTTDTQVSTKSANMQSQSRDGQQTERNSGRKQGGNRGGGFKNSNAGMSYSGGIRISPQDMLPSGDGKEGQSKKKRLKGRRTVDFQQGDFGRHMEEEVGMRFNRGKKRKNPKTPVTPTANTQPIKAAKRKLRVEEAIRVADMAQQIGVKANEIIRVLFGLGVLATINQSLDIDTATLVASEFGYEVEKAGFSEDDYLISKDVDAPESLKPRPPVVTIMGHVDHGKTSLLDAIRKSNVTSGEAGGITQHIGAYHVTTKRGEIVFLDTPGHEAFTAMRARGAQITDLVILVVAADDGVMEQTREAINHSRAANVPIVVAVNKIDKPGADTDRILRELAELGLQPEEWGGDTIFSRVSAKTRQGLDDLLELVALQSEIMDLKANPDKMARGHIIEARLDKGRGPIATVLVQEGTLKQGDNFVCGTFAGKVRALTTDQGKKVKEAKPSIPVEVQGFDGVPEAGEAFMVVADEKLARRIADSRMIKRRERDLATEARITLETFLAHHDDQEAMTLNLVLKADVQGSLEAINEALQKQNTEKVKINVVHGGTGAISESDILLASASKAIIIGFNVRPAARIKDIAERENIDIRFYDIIYKLIDDVKNAMAGMLAPVQREVYLGQAEVRKVYNLPKIGAIAGCYIADGKIVRNTGVRLLREGVVAYTGKISSLKRFKDDAREVVKGNECGVGLENYNDIKVGDIIEAFETVEEAATL